MVRVELIADVMWKLRKSLKDFPANPHIDEVHKLRTQARHVESLIAHVFDRSDKLRPLLAKIVGIRRAAGHVRDIDVFESKTLTLSSHANADSITWLIEHLGQERMKNAAELKHRIARDRKALRSDLEDCSRSIMRGLGSDARASTSEPLAISISKNAHSAALSLVEEIVHWPQFDRHNIHDFRLKVKALRTLLQLNPNSHAKLIDALGHLKDVIGEWHDWYELSKLAGAILNVKADRVALMKINETCRKRLGDAISLANATRENYFLADRRERSDYFDTGISLDVPATEAAILLAG
jgi:CHAD domain-containing protein